MISRTTGNFRQAYRLLPREVQNQARKAYHLFLQDPSHPSLRFKRVHQNPLVYSARVSQDYRALAVREEDTLIWFWIGSHSEYNKIISQL